MVAVQSRDVTGARRQSSGSNAVSQLLREPPTVGAEAQRALDELRRRLFAARSQADIGRYRDVRTIGRGGMGVVYSAWDPVLRRPVAIKFLRLEHSGQRARLRREARALARVVHPNVVRIYDVGSDGEEAHLTMELVEGQDLESWIRRAPRTVDQILTVLAAAGRGLAAAHACGVIHRDFKPSNVLVGHDGRVRVADFGLAVSETVAPSLIGSPDSAPKGETRSSAGGGTPRYMAPEQHRGGLADMRADQYSFAITAWETLCRCEGRPRPVSPNGSALPAAVPLRIAAVLRRASAADPQRRFPTMTALLAALSRHEGRTRRGSGLAVAFGALAVLGWWSMQPSRASIVPADTESVPPGEGRADRINKIVAQLDTGRAALAAGELTQARAAFESAYFAASETDQPQVAFTSAIAMIDLSNRRVAHDEADRWIGYARSWQARVVEPELSVEFGVQQAKTARLRGDLPRARVLIDEVWKDAGESIDGPGAHHVLIELGHLELEHAEYARAAAAFERARTAYRSHSGDLGRERAVLLTNLGNTYWYLDDLTAARKAYARALELRLETVGRRHQETATALMNLGIVDRAEGHYERARTRLDEAVQIAERTAGPDAPQTALALTNLATVESDLGQAKLAIAHHRRATEIYESAWGHEHPRVALALGNLGAAQADAGDLQGAVVSYDAALEIGRAVHDKPHPNVAWTLHNLAIVHRRRGDSGAAEGLDREALMLLKAIVGGKHRAIAEVTVALAHDAGTRSAWGESEALASRALALEPTDPLIDALARIRLARARIEQGDRRRGRAGLDDVAARLEGSGERGSGARDELAAAQARLRARAQRG